MTEGISGMGSGRLERWDAASAGAVEGAKRGAAEANGGLAQRPERSEGDNRASKNMPVRTDGISALTSGDAASSLSGLRSVEFDMTQAFQAIFESLKTLRRERRDAAMEAGVLAEKEGMEAAGEIKDQASMQLASGLTSGVVSAGSSAFVFSGVGMNRGADGMTFANSMMGWQAASQTTQGLGQMTSGAYGMQEKEAESRARMDEAATEEVRAIKDANQQDTQSFASEETQLVDVLRKMDEGEYEAAKGSARNIA